MEDKFLFSATAQEDFIVIPDEAIPFLPSEWREYLLDIKRDGQAIIETADEDLRLLVRLANSFPNVVSLQHIYSRMTAVEFEMTTEFFLDQEMLTLAFVVAYARVVGGGNGSGIARDVLPIELRAAHDEILEWRNMRFAHDAGHETVAQGLEIGLADGCFEINIRFNLTYRFRGSPEWGALVTFINKETYRRLEKILARLKAKTGREWTFPSGPPPKEEG